ncbi:P-loop containing nucleoside triphosphate hydrolase protein [Favolaschia claudopus]|uniref:P-loop containing nucleoside triphosphate hydrolase protein n=1 Tax=Favolaschia claudopus TaxID=2862362 RepID=A0AAV9Z1I3_9AGAR
MSAPSEKSLPSGNEHNGASKAVENEEDAYKTLKLGVWRILLPNKIVSGGIVSATKHKCRAIVQAYPVVQQFFRQVYDLNPHLCLLFIALKLWGEIESVVFLYVSGRLLRIIEVGITEGRPDSSAILQALLAHLICVTVTATARWGRDYVSPILENTVSMHFDDYLLRAKLHLDMPTAADTSNRTQALAFHAWISFDGLCDAFMRLFGLVSQLLYISQQPNAGLLFTVIALARPVMTLVNEKTLWLQPHVAYSDNESYLRLKSLETMGQSRFRGDIISGGIAEWITEEYNGAKDALGTIGSQHSWTLYAMETSPLNQLLADWSGALPTMYWALNALLYPSQLSMTSIAILQQYSASLNSSLQLLFGGFSRVGKCFTDIKTLFDAASIVNRIVDGDLAYPRAEAEFEESKGMNIELQSVSFAYPGEKSKESALNNISLCIPAGSLVVIVGANGSGKSTIIKLITRMYDVAGDGGGQVIIDGIPIQRYRMADLRQAQATLTQEHKLYPLTLAENIGLGHPKRVRDKEMILKAAKDGGAEELVGKMKNGMETMLDPVRTSFGYQLDGEKHRTLKGVLEKLEMATEVSGGETQRLVASRTFMRFQTNKIRLLCVDEPSSALDPRGEFELFERLRQTAEGKTMIFVTHRFGHLTKHADIILCMKNGAVIESGTHKELLTRNGEYASLYNVQAQAFTESEVC